MGKRKRKREPGGNQPGGNQLQAAILGRGLSRSEMAARLAISEVQLSRLISGKRIPSLNLALRIHSEIGIDPLVWGGGH